MTHQEYSQKSLTAELSDEDASGLENEGDRESEIEVPFDPRKIDIVVKTLTVSSLHHRLQAKELDLTPDFQRSANVWDDKRKSRLIESILLRIPLPSFYFSEDDDGVYAVVDGLQRLCAIFHFADVTCLNDSTGSSLSPLRLTGLQYLKEIEGSTFTDLDRKFQRRVMEQDVTTNVIRAGTPIAVKFNVFARLNQGGMPLNAQEIRNAIFPGSWRIQLDKLAALPAFLSITEGKIRTERQQDLELVLRYTALWQLKAPFHRPIGQTLDEFLNNTVEQVLVKWSPMQWQELQNNFKRAIEATNRIFGNQSFRKINNSGHRKPINRSLFESELIAIGSLSDSQIDELERKKERLLSIFKESLQINEKFTQALLYATGSPEASNARIDELNAMIKEVLNA